MFYPLTNVYPGLRVVLSLQPALYHDAGQVITHQDEHTAPVRVDKRADNGASH